MAGVGRRARCEDEGHDRSDSPTHDRSDSPTHDRSGPSTHDRMKRPTHEHPDRGVSEFAGVAILVAITILVTASVGLFVLVDPGSESAGPDANFTFDYVDTSSVLIVSHDRGESLTAGNLTLRSGDTRAGWAEIANTENSTVVEPGSTIQLSRRNAFGRPVSPRDKVFVLHTPPVGNETVLDKWEGSGG
ncbi:type IV pilin [Halosimplex salinum]|uniref:type IV pilin n=1 Tax=Halosimplex salinum TaxID=1710538 RepID=UPI000F47D057|nr:type IV pilin N-terminal domain-containing protein [Halosimplex salinum]